ncbi:RNA-guided endonuclease InsQ/TnpB family protein [Streptomyces arboris]|uniref:IS200/IS605 family element transposase accessory protein TnpB n=1 Tax=Streptomyces arboris TaxID=2600619 RepID=A0A5N5EP69_9ACTN|nr:RNA-guided endonuclease TnpB family protein [Streptomyces arboris]KAB2590492.1 IS200/IS605 family element transposase accessory protein TnpB [Streptomyces arboris]
MAEAAEKDELIRITGAEAERVKREALGVPDRAKHQQRVAVPMQRRTPEADTRQRVYRYRCYPTPTQAEQLIKTFGACRWTYNEGLALRDKAWREHRVSLGFAESCRALTGWRNAEGTRWLQEVSSTVLQQALRHLDTAFGRFFKGTTKHPRPKKKSRSRDSATYVRTGFRWLEDPERPGTGLIALAKQSGPLRIRWSRPLPTGVRPVKLTVSRDRAGRFFVAVLVEERIEPLPPVFLRDGSAPKAVGLDLGLTALVTLDDGEKVDHPRLLKKYGAKLAQLQRSLHRKKRGSSNREKARQEIARLYALIGDVRRDALDQLTTRLVRENQVLVVEDLSIASLVRSPRGKGRRRKAGLNRAILDASWGELLKQLLYKCAWYGRTLVIVDRFFPSTRRCSACGVTGPKLDLAVRSWSCGGCGAVHDRDVNAARNLREEGMRMYELVASALPPGRAMPFMIRASEMPDVVLTA